MRKKTDSNGKWGREQTVMKNKTVAVREAVTEQEISLFWRELRNYQERDIFPDVGQEDREYFSGQEYYNEIQKLHERKQNRCRYLFFQDKGTEFDGTYGGQNIVGIALTVIYDQEDGKCFLLEFCVLPEFRGGGMGRNCAKAFLAWAKEQGAAYVELNYGGLENRARFWKSMGFFSNGRDEWGEPLMLLPPTEDCPVTVEILKDPKDWQLMKLENGYLAEIGEEMLSDEKKERLERAVAEEKIVFFLARRGYRAVGMCSVSLCFSTFACGETGNFEDFYVEPVFRKKGIGRMLAHAAQDWCRAQKVGSLSVCCALCDEEMYQALGFTIRLGASYVFMS